MLKNGRKKFALQEWKTAKQQIMQFHIFCASVQELEQEWLKLRLYVCSEEATENGKVIIIIQKVVRKRFSIFPRMHSPVAWLAFFALPELLLCWYFLAVHMTEDEHNVHESVEPSSKCYFLSASDDESEWRTSKQVGVVIAKGESGWKMKTRIKSKSSTDKASSSLRPHNEATPTRTFPPSFSIFICLLFALFIIEKCFSRSCFCCCHCFASVIVTGFAPSSLFHFFSLPPSPSRIHVSFHPAHKYISILKLDTQKSFPCCLLAIRSTRYLNFILMFVPSINFYNPFINLIKTKHNTIVSLSTPSSSLTFSVPSPFYGAAFLSSNFYSFSRDSLAPDGDQFEELLGIVSTAPLTAINFAHLLAVEVFAAHSADVRWRRCVSSLSVHVVDVILQVGFSREAHGTAGDGALKDPLIGVLSQVLAQRLSTEQFLAQLAFDFELWIVIERQSVKLFVKEKFGMWIGSEMIQSLRHK